MDDELLPIGRFSALSRLSQKALRLYDDRGLIVPARIDPVSGYRYYRASQVDRARLVGMLRGLAMSLPQIGGLLDLPGPEAAELVRAHVAGARRQEHAREPLADHVCDLLHEGSETMSDDFDVKTRAVPERAVLTATRRVHAEQAEEVLGGLLGRMSRSGPGLSGADGCPYLVHYADVSADSDGPVEVVRPMADPAAARAAADALGDVQATIDPAHDEAYVVLTMSQTRSPLHPVVLDAIERWAAGAGRRVAAYPRQVMIADWRTAGPDEPAAMLAVTLEPAGSD